MRLEPARRRFPYRRQPAQSSKDWSINSVAGYAVYRSTGGVHVKAKLGVSLWDDDSGDGTSLTAGIGNRSQIETPHPATKLD